MFQCVCSGCGETYTVANAMAYVPSTHSSYRLLPNGAWDVTICGEWVPLADKPKKIVRNLPEWF